MTAPKPGDQLAGVDDSTRVVVVKAPAEGGPAIECGGRPMVAAAGPRPAPGTAGSGGTQLGKRYVDATGAVEVLCTSPGAGELTCGGAPMTLKSAKPLPASD